MSEKFNTLLEQINSFENSFENSSFNTWVLQNEKYSW